MNSQNMKKAGIIGGIAIVAVLLITALASKKKPLTTKAVVLVTISDTAKVTFVYRGKDSSVLWKDGYMISTGLKAMGHSEQWMSQPTVQLLDTFYHVFNGRWISINTR